MFLLSYLVLINSHENLRGKGGGGGGGRLEGTLDLQSSEVALYL